MNLHYETSGVRLSPPQARAIDTLLTRTALAHCAGVEDRIDLTEDVLTVESLGTWRWSSGELLLLQVLLFVLGEAAPPCDLSIVDEPNEAVVREVLGQLAADEAVQQDRLLSMPGSRRSPRASHVEGAS